MRPLSRLQHWYADDVVRQEDSAVLLIDSSVDTGAEVVHVELDVLINTRKQ